MELVGLHQNPVPDGANVGQLRCEGGVLLRYSWWKPTMEPVRGTVCLFGGRGEFIEKYFETIAELRRRGFYVAMMDWRGQGGSSRYCKDHRKGHIWDFSQYEADLHSFMTNIVLPDMPKPYFALAQSMGGHVLLRHGIFRMSHFDRMVILAPMLKISQKRLMFPKPIVKMISNGCCWTGLGQKYVLTGDERGDEKYNFETNPLTNDKARFERWIALLKAAPYLGVGAPTFGWMKAALASMDQLMARGMSEKIKVPTLVFAGGMDEVISNKAIKQFAEGGKNISVQTISHAKHEILLETDLVRDQFWGAFDAFVPGALG